MSRPPKSDYAPYYNGGKMWYLSLADIRAVWQAISANPLATRHDLAEQVGFSISKVQAIMHYLHESGYISMRKNKGDRAHCSRAVTINIPLGTGVIHKIEKLESK